MKNNDSQYPRSFKFDIRHRVAPILVYNTHKCNFLWQVSKRTKRSIISHVILNSGMELKDVHYIKFIFGLICEFSEFKPVILFHLL